MFLLTEDCHVRKDSLRELFMPTLLAVRCHSFDSNFHTIWYTVQTYSAHINPIYFCHFRVSQRSTGMWQMVIKSDYTCSGVRFHLSCHLVHSNEDWVCSVSPEWCEPNLSHITELRQVLPKPRPEAAVRAAVVYLPYWPFQQHLWNASRTLKV